MNTLPPPRVRSSLWTRIFLLVACLVAVSTAAISVLLLARMRDAMVEAFRERGELVARGFSQKVAEGVLIEDQRILGRSIDELFADKDIVYVAVYGDSGLRLAHKAAVPGIDAPPSTGIERDKGPASEIRRMVPGDGAAARVLAIAMPVRYEDQTVGRVDVGISLARIDTEIRDRIWNALLLLVVFLSCGSVVSLAFSRSLTKPIKDLLKGVQRVGEGDLSHRIAIRREDEIGRLASAVNDMAAGLQAKTTSIENLHAEIQARKETERQLDIAVKRAEDASVAKSRFLANMSHEIRTPMNAVLGFADLLALTTLGDEQREYVTTIRDSGGLLLSLINDILDISKIEAGKITLEAVPFDLEELLDGALKIVSSKIVGKDLDLTLDYDKAVPRSFTGDPTRLRQIMMNLLGNAVKFTEQGEIVVTVASARGAADAPAAATDGCPVRISVRDTGIGIPRDKIGGLFQAFTQVDASVTRRFGGTGLGLTIAKALVERMHGAIRIESEEGKGSDFIFTVLLAEGPACREAKDQLPDTAALRNRTVVIADDRASVCRVLRVHCEDAGMHVLHVCHGSDALFAWCDQYRDCGPDFLIIDALLPVLGRGTTTKRLREHAALSRAAIVGLTSTPLDRNASSSGVSRFALYVAKPFSARELYKTLLQAAGRAERGKSAAVRIAGASPLAGKRVLVVEDNETNLMLVTTVLRKTSCVIETAGDGREAVEKVRQARYDVILMDVQMPGMDGLEATRVIRTELRNETPIIALTGAAMKEDEQRVRESGMDDYIAKPLDIELLTRKTVHWATVGRR